MATMITAPHTHAAATAATTTGPLNGAESPLPVVELPDIEAWEVPVRCFKCGESYTAPARHFRIGNVLWCPHCHKSMVVKDNLNFQLRTALEEFYEKWQREQTELQAKRERDLREFKEKHDQGLADFKIHQQQELAKIKARLQQISESYNAPGRPAKKGGLLGWL